VPAVQQWVRSRTRHAPVATRPTAALRARSRAHDRVRARARACAHARSPRPTRGARTDPAHVARGSSGEWQPRRVSHYVLFSGACTASGGDPSTYFRSRVVMPLQKRYAVASLLSPTGQLYYPPGAIPYFCETAAIPYFCETARPGWTSINDILTKLRVWVRRAINTVQRNAQRRRERFDQVMCRGRSFNRARWGEPRRPTVEGPPVLKLREEPPVYTWQYTPGRKRRRE